MLDVGADYQRFIRAIGYAHWSLLSLAKVAFKHFLAFYILLHHPEWANQQTCPAANASLLVYLDQRAHGVTSESTSNADLNTWSFITLLTMH